MKILPEKLKTHIKGETTTLCRCWIIEMTSGKKLGFTDHDQTITLKGTICEKDAGMEASSVEERLGLNTNTSEISGALQSELITEEAIRTGLLDRAKVSTYVVNWQDSSQYFLDQVFLVGDITREDGHFRMELRSLSSQLEQTKGNHFIKKCQADLGDLKCKVNLSSATYTSTGLIERVRSPVIFWVSGLNEFENAWFRAGGMTFQTGENAGLKVEISEHIRSDGITVLHLWQPMPKSVSVGDEFTITAGCNKSLTTCSEKFSNTLNFRGFPHMPGNAFALSYASNSENFDGGPIIE